MMHRINVNGVTYEVTEEEAAKYEAGTAEFPPPAPSHEERLQALEDQLKAAKILLGLEE